MRSRDICESEAIEYYTPMAKELGLDASDNMAVRKLIETADHVHADCQFYLRQINTATPAGHVDTAWRGLGMDENHNKQILKKDVRLDGRNPKDTDVDTHNYINRTFVELYGAKFRDALFVTGSEREVARYGRAFQVFPIGQFKFIWSPVVRDLWIEARDVRDALKTLNSSRDSNDQLIRQKHASKVFKDFNERILGSYQSDDLSRALKSRSEIMIRASSYYAVSFDNITNNVLDENKIYPDSYWMKIRAATEELFYNIVNNK